MATKFLLCQKPTHRTSNVRALFFCRSILLCVCSCEHRQRGRRRFIASASGGEWCRHRLCGRSSRRHGAQTIRVNTSELLNVARQFGAFFQLAGSFDAASVAVGNVLCRGGAELCVPVRTFVARLILFDDALPILKVRCGSPLSSLIAASLGYTRRNFCARDSRGLRCDKADFDQQSSNRRTHKIKSKVKRRSQKKERELQPLSLLG